MFGRMTATVQGIFDRLPKCLPDALPGTAACPTVDPRVSEMISVGCRQG